jgi:thioredoxin reductase
VIHAANHSAVSQKWQRSLFCPSSAGTLDGMNKYDVAIIGGGAAGLSAALVLARARRRVRVLDGGAPRNAPAAHMHGFLSRDGLPPAQLLTTARDEVASYGGEIDRATVVEVGSDQRTGFWLILGNGERVSARRVLVATGLRDELPDIPGLRDRWARDVLHCPYCHGFEVRDRPLGVLGGSDEAVRYAQIVRQWSDDLVFFAQQHRLTDEQRAHLAAREIGVVEGPVRRLVIDDDRLTGVEMTDGRIIARAALFVPPRFLPNDHLLLSLGCQRDQSGWVPTDRTGYTGVPGLWAAGNVVNPRAQVITAAGEGSAAAIAINADLVDEDVRNAIRDRGRTD